MLLQYLLRKIILQWCFSIVLTMMNLDYPLHILMMQKKLVRNDKRLSMTKLFRTAQISSYSKHKIASPVTEWETPRDCTRMVGLVSDYGPKFFR